MAMCFHSDHYRQQRRASGFENGAFRTVCPSYSRSMPYMLRGGYPPGATLKTRGASRGLFRCITRAARKSPNVIDAIRSPARERREVYVGTFSLSSRSGLQPEIVILYVSERVATYSSMVHSMHRYS